MSTHTLKFADGLATMIAHGEKSVTWRLWNEKVIEPCDDIWLVVGRTAVFGRATVEAVRDTTFTGLTPEDRNGHEFVPDDELLSTYAGYYGRPVTENDNVTVVRFAVNMVATVPGSEETDVIVIGPGPQ